MEDLPHGAHISNPISELLLGRDSDYRPSSFGDQVAELVLQPVDLGRCPERRYGVGDNFPLLDLRPRSGSPSPLVRRTLYLAIAGLASRARKSTAAVPSRGFMRDPPCRFPGTHLLQTSARALQYLTAGFLKVLLEECGHPLTVGLSVCEIGVAVIRSF